MTTRRVSATRVAVRSCISVPRSSAMRSTTSRRLIRSGSFASSSKVRAHRASLRRAGSTVLTPVSAESTDLKIGVGERMIFPALHPDAQNMFNVCSDIKKTCLKLWNKLYRLPNEVSLRCWNTRGHADDVLRATGLNRASTFSLARHTSR